jgi:SAM-dependent methyltransferase
MASRAGMNMPPLRQRGSKMTNEPAIPDEVSMSKPENSGQSMWGYDSEQLLLIYSSMKKELKDRPLALSNMPHILVRSMRYCIQLGRQRGWMTGFRMACWGLRDLVVRNTNLLFPVRYPYARSRFAFGIQPLSYLWGLDRGVPVHRYYLRQFIQEFSSDIRGHCLEFQEDSYSSQFGENRITKIDILHKEGNNPNATIIADITKSNNIPSNLFDCIICTYVLNVIFEVDEAISELYRMLKPGGVLLVAVPQFTMLAIQWHDVWRFTPEGLYRVLTKVFGSDDVRVRAYGNSLTAAGDIRALVADEFTKAELEYYDPRFAIVVCARAVKRS